MTLFIFFGMRLNIFLTELALTAVDQVTLKMKLHCLVDLTSGMRCIPFLSLKFLDLVHVCQTTLKSLGIGTAEWSLSDIKTIKKGKGAKIGGK